MVLTSLPGEEHRAGQSADAPRYIRTEKVVDFRSSDFTNEKQLELMAEVCIASGALPLLFPPHPIKSSELREASPYWDGGIVNNTPIALAIKPLGQENEGAPLVDHMIVITPNPNLPARAISWLPFGRLIELLI